MSTITEAMLDNAVVAVKADQPGALAMFLKGEGGFRDRDLYPFCFRSGDGKALASPPSVPSAIAVPFVRGRPFTFLRLGHGKLI